MVFPVRISGPFYGGLGNLSCKRKRIAGTHGVKSNGKGTAGLDLLGLTGVVDDGLVVLIRAVREVHADNVETSCELSVWTPYLLVIYIPIPLRSALIFSVELVLGPVKN